MTANDPFGLGRESRIVASGIRGIFTPHQPIRSVDLFFGRQKEVQKIVEQINTPGQHCLLYGDRGVGKTSLANIATQVLIQKLVEGRLYTKRCASGDSFESIVLEPLRLAGVDVDSLEKSTSTELTGGGKVALPGITELGGKGTRKTSMKHKLPPLNPSFVAENLQAFVGVLYVDEVDALPSDEDRKKLAELIKLLSDCGSPFKLLVVGIADTADQLTAAHPSVHRCLKENKLRRMGKDELGLIVTQGMAKASLVFEENVINAIVRLSSGYPHFTHLLALKCAEEAIAAEARIIRLPDLSAAMRLAVDDAEATLRRKYNEATRSYSTKTYADILLAAAKLNRDEFSAGQLRESVSRMTGEPMTQNSLNNFLKRLVSDNGSTILVRKAKGIYKFADPRMPSFIKIVHAVTDEDTQPAA